MALLCVAKRTNRPPCTSCALITLSLFLFYGEVLTRSVTSIDGLTLHINSGQAAAAAPMSASLYMAPQTYDRGKERFQRRRNPYILVPKVRLACDWTLQGLGRGAHPHRHKVEAVDVHINTSDGGGGGGGRTPATSSSPSWSDVGTGLHHAVQLNDFPGSWHLNKPDSTNQDRPINELVTYNEDGTRVLPETLANSDTNTTRGGPESSPTDNYFHNITSDISAAESTSPKPEVTSSEQSVQTFAAATATDGDRTRTEGWTTTIGTAAPRPLKRRQEFYSVTVATTATAAMAATYNDRYNDDEDDDMTTNQSPTIMDKLGGGAKKILAHILGGILHGRQTQKNLEVKDTASSTVDRNSDRLTVDSVGLSPISYSNLLPNFSSSPVDHHSDTGATPIGDHPMKEATATTAPPPIVTGVASNDENGSHRSSADSGWRPVIQWPSAWLNGRPPSRQSGARRPAPPPANLIHYWTSTTWNETIVNTGSRSTVSKAETEQSLIASGDRPSFAEATSTISPPPLLCQNNVVSHPRLATVASDNSIDGGQNKNSNVSGESASNATEVELDKAVNGTAGEFTESKVLNSADAEQRPRCISIGDTIRALIRVYDRFPVGIPKPFDILLSYGQHHWNKSRPRRSEEAIDNCRGDPMTLRRL